MPTSAPPATKGTALSPTALILYHSPSTPGFPQSRPQAIQGYSLFPLADVPCRPQHDGSVQHIIDAACGGGETGASSRLSKQSNPYAKLLARTHPGARRLCKLVVYHNPFYVPGFIFRSQHHARHPPGHTLTAAALAPEHTWLQKRAALPTRVASSTKGVSWRRCLGANIPIGKKLWHSFLTH